MPAECVGYDVERIPLSRQMLARGWRQRYIFIQDSGSRNEALIYLLLAGVIRRDRSGSVSSLHFMNKEPS